MLHTLRLRSLLVVGASAAALTAAAQPAAAQSVIEELVVTAQRREQALQDVPVAVSAFSEDTLKTQRLDGGQNLLQAIPNVNFSRSNFGGYNFSIRGIGTKVVGTGEAGVSFHQNNSPLTPTAWRTPNSTTWNGWKCCAARRALSTAATRPAASSTSSPTSLSSATRRSAAG
jgi:outer membrane receptor protein involved in Fe transport